MPWGILIDLGVKLGGLIFEAATASEERRKQLAAEADKAVKACNEQLATLKLTLEHRNEVNLQRAIMADRLYVAGISADVPTKPL